MAGRQDVVAKAKEIHALQQSLCCSFNLPTVVLETLNFIGQQYEELITSGVKASQSLSE